MSDGRSGIGKGWTSLLPLLLLVLAVAGCGQPPPPLRVGINPWPGYEPLSLAKDLGYFDGQDITVVMLPSTSECLRAYRNGAVDAVGLTLDEALYAAETDPDQRIVLVCDYSKGADCILAQPQFGTLADLRGRRIGVESNALGAYMVTRALQVAGLTAAEVTVMPLPLEEQEAAFAAKQVDAVVTFEPGRSRLLAQGAHSVFDSSQIPGEIIDVILTNSRVTVGRKKAMATLVEGWFRARSYLLTATADAARRAAPRVGLSAAEFSAALKGMELPDRALNARLLGNSAESIAGTLRRVQTVMLEHRLLNQVTESPVRLDDGFVREDSP